MAFDLGMTVDSLLDSMPLSELFKWFVWYEQRDKHSKGEEEPIEQDWENMDSSEVGNMFNL